MLTKFASIGSYSTEGRTFGTLITSTNLFSLINPQNFFDHTPKTILYLSILDSVYLEILDSVPN